MAKSAKKAKEEKVEEVVPVVETQPVVEETTPEVKEEEPVKTVEVEGEEIELMEVTVTQEMVDEHIEFQENDIKAGDVIQVALTDEGDAKLTASVEAQPEPVDETEALSKDAERWERYLKSIGLTPEKFLETRQKHPFRHHVEEIVAKKKK